MKKLFLSLIAMAFATGMMAQDSRVATLQHGTNFRTYYGLDAFISAHTDAADGDVITLTEGTFNGCAITKAVTIRGEGMKRTMISNNISVKAPQSTYSVVLEGLDISPSNNHLEIKGNTGAETVVLSKCSMSYNNYNGLWVRNCKVVAINFDNRSRTSVERESELSLINSRVQQISSSDNGKYNIQNCVINGTANVSYSSIKNSIIYGVTKLNDTNTTSNCLLKDGSSGFANSWYVKTEPDVNPDPWGEDPETPVLWDELFGEDYHLTDAAAATYIGTDGTQIGIWGGAYPWNETPDYPLVNKLEVKGIHENGKLQVKINVQ